MLPNVPNEVHSLIWQSRNNRKSNDNLIYSTIFLVVILNIHVSL